VLRDLLGMNYPQPNASRALVAVFLPV